MLKRYLKQITYAVICLLLLNTGLTVASTLPVDAPGDGAERVLLCTAQGYKWVTLDTTLVNEPTVLTEASNTDLNQEQKTQSNHTNTGHDCLYCAFGMAMPGIAVNNTVLAIALTPRFNGQAIEYREQTDKFLEFHPSLHRLSRAPPATI